MKPAVLVYRSELLPVSETFIAAQAGALQHYQPVFIGTRHVQNTLSLPGPSLVPSLRAAGRLLYRQTGHAPGLLSRAAAYTPAVMHAHFALDAAEALPLARALRLPLLVTLHGYDVMCSDGAHTHTRAGRLYLQRRAKLLQEAAAFLCVSAAVRNQARARGFPPNKLQVLPIGIDTEGMTQRAGLGCSDVILFVGRLVEKKGCHVLLQAVNKLQQHAPDVRLVIAGDGPERSALERLATETTVGTRFLGAQRRDQVQELMREARCLAVPSITAANQDAEGLPTVIAEALAIGLPVASTVHSGIPEIITHGQEGLLAPECDSGALAANLMALCRDDELAKRFSDSGRARVLREFDLARQTAKLERIYEQTSIEHFTTLGIARGSDGSCGALIRESSAAGRLTGSTEAVLKSSHRITPSDGRLERVDQAQATREPNSSARSQLRGSGAACSKQVRLGKWEGRSEPPTTAGKEGAANAALVEAQAKRSKQADAGEQTTGNAAACKPSTPTSQRLRYQAAWLLSGSGFATLCQALYFLLMGRMLGSQEYGAFAGIVALVNVGSQFSSIGMEMVLLRSLARERSCFALVWGRALLISMAGAIALLGILEGYAHLFLIQELRSLVPYLVLADAFGGKITQLASRVFQGLDMARWSAKLLALTNTARACAAGCLFLFCTEMHRHIAALAWARVYLGASLFVGAFSFIAVTVHMGWPKRATVRLAHLAEGLSFSFSSSAISVYNDIDKTLLVSYGMLREAGIYAAAYRVLDVASTPIYSLFAAASPRLFRSGSTGGPPAAAYETRALLRWAGFFGIGLAPMLFFCAPLIPRLFGHSFSESVEVLRFLCLLPFLRALHYAWGTAVTACANQWLRTATQATVALFNLLLNLWLIPTWGWHGAAAASLASDGLLGLLSLVVLQLLVVRSEAGEQHLAPLTN